MIEETERWKALDAASYDDVADAYDAFSHQLAEPVAERLVEMAALVGGERTLDVGTGTGMIPFAIARLAPPSCSVVGADISSGMIEKARRKAAASGLPEGRVSFRQQDAEELTLEDDSFDVVLSAFALGHMPRPERAAAEMLRVMKPGGRLIVAVGSRPPVFSVDTVTHAVAELRRRLASARGLRRGSDLLDQVVDRRLPPDEDVPHGSELATQLNRSASLAELIRTAGFSRVETSWRNYQNEVATSDRFWEIQRTICTRARKRLLMASDSLVQAVRAEFIETCDGTLKRGGRLVFPVSAVFIAARKPS